MGNICVKKWEKRGIVLFSSFTFSKASMWQIISNQKLNSQCVNNENSNTLCQCHQRIS